MPLIVALSQRVPLSRVTALSEQVAQLLVGPHACVELAVEPHEAVAVHVGVVGGAAVHGVGRQGTWGGAAAAAGAGAEAGAAVWGRGPVLHGRGGAAAAATDKGTVVRGGGGWGLRAVRESGGGRAGGIAGQASAVGILRLRGVQVPATPGEHVQH